MACKWQQYGLCDLRDHKTDSHHFVGLKCCGLLAVLKKYITYSIESLKTFNSGIKSALESIEMGALTLRGSEFENEILQAVLK